MKRKDSSQKVILLRPPEDSPRDFYSIVESLGIAYIASYIREKGEKVRIIDSIIQDLDVKQTVNYLLREDFDILGITLFNVAVDKTRRILKILKKEKPYVHINVGGHYPTFAYKEIIDNIEEIDSVTRFEGEITFYELIQALRGKVNPQKVPGLVIRNSKNEFYLTPHRERIKNLDSLPFPSRETWPRIQKDKKAFSVCSSRGCWAKCKYCTITQFYSSNGVPKWVGRTPQNVLNEIEKLINEYNSKFFAFVDADFFGPGYKGKQRVKTIAQEIIKRRLNIKYAFDCRPDDIDEELFTFLKETGLSLVYLGLESGVQAQLARWGRQCNLEDGLKAVDILKKLGILIQAGFILYDPWTTLDEIVASLEFIKEVKVVSLPLFVRAMEIRPGMDLEKKLIEESNIYKRAPFDYGYYFKDKKVTIFRDGISYIFEDLLNFYKKFAEEREKSTLASEESAKLERYFIGNVVDIALNLALELKKLTLSDEIEIKKLFKNGRREAEDLCASFIRLFASVLTIKNLICHGRKNSEILN